MVLTHISKYVLVNGRARFLSSVIYPPLESHTLTPSTPRQCLSDKWYFMPDPLCSQPFCVPEAPPPPHQVLFSGLFSLQGEHRPSSTPPSIALPLGPTPLFCTWPCRVRYHASTPQNRVVKNHRRLHKLRQDVRTSHSLIHFVDTKKDVT